MATFHSNIHSNLCSSENKSMILGVFLVVKRVFYHRNVDAHAHVTSAAFAQVGSSPA
jgi:hypothetical protein